MGIASHIFFLLGYFTPARSPMLSVAMTATLSLIAVSGYQAPSSGVSEGGQVRRQADGYFVKNDTVWWAIAIPFYIVLCLSIPISIAQYSHLPKYMVNEVGENAAIWNAEFNLTRAICLAAPMVLLITSTEALPGEKVNFGSVYFQCCYSSCIAQLSLFVVFLFAETQAKSRHYNLIQFSMITSCFLMGASISSMTAAHFEAEFSGHLNRYQYTMIGFYVVWLSCMLCWAYYLLSMTRIRFEFVDHNRSD